MTAVTPSFHLSMTHRLFRCVCSHCQRLPSALYLREPLILVNPYSGSHKTAHPGTVSVFSSPWKRWHLQASTSELSIEAVGGSHGGRLHGPIVLFSMGHLSGIVKLFCHRNAHRAVSNTRFDCQSRYQRLPYRLTQAARKGCMRVVIVIEG